MSEKKSAFYRLFYLLSLICGIAYVLGYFMKGDTWSGWLLMGFFVFLSIAFRGNNLLKGFSYSFVILAAVSLAMHYPSYFVSWGSFKYSTLIVPLLQIIMFGMGTQLSLNDFKNVAGMPKGILVGIVCQFTIMPVLGFTLTRIFNFPNEIAAGIILVGSCPSGLASNVMSYLAKANLALSVTLTTFTTLLAPLATPLLMKIFANQYVEVHFLSMLWDITKIVIIPIVGGLIFHRLVHGKYEWLDKAMPFVSMAGIAFIIVVITAAGRDSLLEVGALLVLATLIHNCFGYLLGYWSARLLRFTEKDSRTIALEVGMQNAGLASGLALTMGKLATVGLAPAIFGPLMNITGSSLASWWHNRQPQEEDNIVPAKIPTA